MKKFKNLAAMGLILAVCAGCGAPASAESAEKENAEDLLSAEEGVRRELFTWVPEGAPCRLSQTEALPELAAVIAETYQIPEEEWENTRYYYDYVDLNGDGDEEIFAVVMGMYTSGSGGDSGMIVLPYAGMTVKQTFTLLRMPVFVSDESTGDAKDLVFLRSGGGSEPALVRLTSTDGVYTNPADAETIDSLEGIAGTAILCNDLMADMESSSALTLAD